MLHRFSIGTNKRCRAFVDFRFWDCFDSRNPSPFAETEQPELTNESITTVIEAPSSVAAADEEVRSRTLSAGIAEDTNVVPSSSSAAGATSPPLGLQVLPQAAPTRAVLRLSEWDRPLSAGGYLNRGNAAGISAVQSPTAGDSRRESAPVAGVVRSTSR